MLFTVSFSLLENSLDAVCCPRLSFCFHSLVCFFHHGQISFFSRSQLFCQVISLLPLVTYAFLPLTYLHFPRPCIFSHFLVCISHSIVCISHGCVCTFHPHVCIPNNLFSTLLPVFSPTYLHFCLYVTESHTSFLSQLPLFFSSLSTSSMKLYIRTFYRQSYVCCAAHFLHSTSVFFLYIFGIREGM